MIYLTNCFPIYYKSYYLKILDMEVCIKVPQEDLALPDVLFEPTFLQAPTGREKIETSRLLTCSLIITP